MNRIPPGTDTWVFGLSSTFTMAAAISAGSTALSAPTPCVPLINSVLTNGGMTTLTSTPCEANSSAIAVDSPTTANLVPA